MWGVQKQGHGPQGDNYHFIRELRDRMKQSFKPQRLVHVPGQQISLPKLQEGICGLDIHCLFNEEQGEPEANDISVT